MPKINDLIKTPIVLLSSALLILSALSITFSPTFASAKDAVSSPLANNNVNIFSYLDPNYFGADIQPNQTARPETGLVSDEVKFIDTDSAVLPVQNMSSNISSVSPIITTKMISDGGTDEGGIWPGDTLLYTVSVTADAADAQDLTLSPVIPEGGTIEKIVKYYVAGADNPYSMLSTNTLYKTITTPKIINGTQIHLAYLPKDATLVFQYEVKMPLHPEEGTLFTAITELTSQSAVVQEVSNTAYLTTPWEESVPAFAIANDVTEDEISIIEQKILDAGYSIEETVVEGNNATFGINVPYETSVMDALNDITALDENIDTTMPNFVMQVFDTEDTIESIETVDETVAVSEDSNSDDVEETDKTDETDNAGNSEYINSISEESMNGNAGIVDPIDSSENTVSIYDESLVENPLSTEEISAAASLPNDPMAINSSNPMIGQNQFYLYSSKATDAWKTVTTDKAVTVAVIDTGCLLTHEDLSANIVGSYDGTTGNAISSDDMDTMGHGTNCNGVVGGVANNGKGIAGVAYNPKLYPVKAARKGDTKGMIETWATYNGLQHLLYLHDQGQLPDLRVISMSFGAQSTTLGTAGVNYYKDYITPIFEAFRERGILLVAAAGNGDASGNPLSDPTYPANCDGVLSVMALNYNDTFAPFSNYGDWCDIATYGMWIWTTDYTGTSAYRYQQGTSFSCPLTAGAAALLFSAYPTASADDVENALRQSSDTMSVAQAGWVPKRPTGKLNITAALSYLQQHHSSTAPTTPLPTVKNTFTSSQVTNGGTVDPGTTIEFEQTTVIQKASIFEFKQQFDLGGLTFDTTKFSWGTCQTGSATDNASLVDSATNRYTQMAAQPKFETALHYLSEANNRGFGAGSTIVFKWGVTVPNGSDGKTFTIKFNTTGKTKENGSSDVNLTDTFVIHVSGELPEGTLGLTKTSTDRSANEEVSVDDTVTYKVEAVANTHQVPNISITDTIPAGLTLQGQPSVSASGKAADELTNATATVSVSGKNIEVKAPNGLNSNSKITLTYTCKVEDGTSHETLTNLVSAKGGLKQDKTASSSFSIKRAAPKPGTFQVTKTNNLGGGHTKAGQSVSYTVVGMVTGGPISDIKFLDEIPDGLSVKNAHILVEGRSIDGSAISPKIKIDNNTVRMEEPLSLQEGSKITISYDCDIQDSAEGKTVTNTATFSASDSNSVSAKSNIIVDKRDPSELVYPAMEKPVITFDGGNKTKEVSLGDTIVYSVSVNFPTVTNDNAASSIQFSDTLPNIVDASKAELRVYKGTNIDDGVSWTITTDGQTIKAAAKTPKNVVGAYTFKVTVPIKSTYSMNDVTVDELGKIIIPNFADINIIESNKSTAVALKSADSADLQFSPDDPNFTDKPEPPVPGTPSLTVTKRANNTASGAPFKPGVAIDYTISVKVGSVGLSELSIVDTLQTGLKILAGNDNLHLRYPSGSATRKEFSATTTKVNLTFTDVAADTELTLEYKANVTTDAKDKANLNNVVVVNGTAVDGTALDDQDEFTVSADNPSSTNTNTNKNTNKNTNTNVNKNTNTNKNKNTNTTVNRNKNTNTNVNRNKNTTTNKNTNTNKNKNTTNKNTTVNKNTNTNTNVRLPFTDVKSNAWYYDAVKWSYSQKLLTGYEGTTLFGPNDNLTRGQAALILWRWFEPSQANKYVASRGINSTPFSDNLNGQYYTGAINWAYKQGIFTGYEGTSLVGVYDSLTRQQMCTVMYRCATKLSHTSSNYSNVKYDKFPDKRDVSEYARVGMAWCVDNGVITGWDKKYLAPAMTIDRAQMSQIMMNAVTKKVLR